MTTEAGRRLRELPGFASYPDTLADAIAAIEAEAFTNGVRHEQALYQDALAAHIEQWNDERAALLAELRREVEGLPAQPYTLSGLDTTTDSRMVNRAAVLDLIRKAGEKP